MAAALDALVEPRCAVPFLVDIDGKRLSTAIASSFHQGHLEAVGMLRQGVGA